MNILCPEDLFAGPVGIVVAPFGQGKSRDLVPFLLRQTEQAVAIVREVGSVAGCITYASAPHLLHATATEVVLILDDLDSLTTASLAFLLMLRGRHGAGSVPRVILVVHSVPHGQRIARFITAGRDAAVVIHWSATTTLPDPRVDVMYLPHYMDDGAVAAAHLVSSFLPEKVMVFAGRLKTAQSIVELIRQLGRTTSIELVHTESDARQCSITCRVRVVTDHGESFLTIIPPAQHIIDVGSTMGQDDAGDWCTTFPTLDTARRRASRGGHGGNGTCMRLYGRDDIVVSRLTCHRADRVQAICMAAVEYGGLDVTLGLDAETNLMIDWKPALREALGRKLLMPTGQVTETGMMAASARVSAPVAEWLCRSVGRFAQWAVMLGAVIQTRSKPTDATQDLVDYVHSMHPWTKRSGQLTGVYQYILQAFKMKQTLCPSPSRDAMRAVLETVYARDLCIKIDGPWYACPGRGKILKAPSPVLGDVLLAIMIRGDAIQTFVALTGRPRPEKLVSVVVHAHGPTTAALEQALAQDRQQLLHKGVYATVRKPFSVKSVCLESQQDKTREELESWVEALCQRMMEGPEEVTTNHEGLRLVIGPGGAVLDVLLQDDCVTMSLPRQPPLSILQGLKARLSVIHPVRWSLTASNREDYQRLVTRLQNTGIKTEPLRTRAPTTEVPIKAVASLEARWAIGPSLGRAVVHVTPETRLYVPPPLRLSESRVVGEFAPPLPPLVALVIENVPLDWGEQRLHAELGGVCDVVHICRDHDAAQSSRPNTLKWFMHRVVAAHSPSPSSDSITAGGVRTMRVVLPNLVKARDILHSKTTILPERVEGQPTRVKLSVRASIRKVATDLSVMEAVLAGRQRDFTVELDPSDPSQTPGAVQAWEEALQSVEAIGRDVTPSTYYDPRFTRLRGISRWPGVYVTHQPLSPTIDVYGPSALRDEVLQHLLERIEHYAPVTVCGVSGTCPICMEAPKSCVLLGCRHATCFECMCQYLTVTARDGGMFSCPEITCRRPIAWDDVRRLADPQAIDTWKEHQVRALSLKDPVLLPTCPGGCGVVLHSREVKSYACERCNLAFCVSCSLASGAPVTDHRGPCELVRRREERREYVRKLLVEGIHPCPTCATPIEKAQGCSHMQCTMPGCRTHFCWGCLQQFTVVAADRAEGVVEAVDTEMNRAMVVIDASTWNTPDRCPLPENHVLYLKANLVEPVGTPHASAVAIGMRVYVETEIYEHIHQCAKLINPL